MYSQLPPARPLYFLALCKYGVLCKFRSQPQVKCENVNMGCDHQEHFCNIFLERKARLQKYFLRWRWHYLHNLFPQLSSHKEQAIKNTFANKYICKFRKYEMNYFLQMYSGGQMQATKNTFANKYIFKLIKCEINYFFANVFFVAFCAFAFGGFISSARILSKPSTLFCNLF